MPATLAINPDDAFAILLKAREFDAKIDQTDPDSGSNPTDDGAADALEFGPKDATEAELASAIDDLNDDAQIDLLALTMVGRGDYSLEEWDDARRSAIEVGRKHARQYLTKIPMVSDFLQEGLSQFSLTIDEYLERH